MLLWASGDVVELRLAAGGRRLGATAVGGFPRAVDSDNDSSVLRDAWRAEVVIEGDGPCIPVHTDEIEVESLSTDEKRTVSKDSTHPVTLARPERPYDRLVVRANGADAAFASQLAGGGGASTKTRASASLFVPEIDYNRTNPSSAEVVVYFRSTVKQVTPQQQPHACYLGVDVASGIWCAGPKLTEEEHVKGSRSTFYCGFMVMKSPKVLRLGDTAAPPRPPSSSTSSYVDEQGKFFVPSWKMRRFEREGYVVLSGHVPEPELRGCQRMLTRLLGVPGALVAGGTQSGLGKLCGAASTSPEVRSLLKCAGVAAALRQFLGDEWDSPSTSAGSSASAPVTGQIAMRFPEHTHLSIEELDSAEVGKRILKSYAWHTDGFRRGKVHEFSVLLGVCLSDCVDDYCGNLLVWPETHKMIHSCLVGDYGDIDLHRLAQISGNSRGLTATECSQQSAAPRNLDSTTARTDLTSDPMLESESQAGAGGREQEEDLTSFLSRKRAADNACELPDLGPPEQVKMRAGDIVLLHPELAHAGGPNLSSTIRTMVYFRIQIQSPASLSDDGCLAHGARAHLSNMWNDFKGFAERGVL